MKFKANFKTVSAILIVALMTFGLAGISNAQHMMKIEGGEVFMLQEIGAVFLEQDGKITVLITMPPERRIAAYKDVDLQKDDEIIMFNGKKAKSVKIIEDAYNQAKVGDNLKFGIKRNGEMRIVSLDKGAEEDLPKLQMATKTIDDGGQEIEGGMKIMKGPEGLEDFNELEMLQGSGIIAGEKEGVFSIASLMPNADKAIGEGKLYEGDIIVKFNGNELKTLVELAKLYNDVEVGQPITLQLSRDGKPVVVIFNKPENSPNMMIQKK